MAIGYLLDPDGLGLAALIYDIAVDPESLKQPRGQPLILDVPAEIPIRPGMELKHAAAIKIDCQDKLTVLGVRQPVRIDEQFLLEHQIRIPDCLSKFDRLLPVEAFEVEGGVVHIPQVVDPVEHLDALYFRGLFGEPLTVDLFALGSGKAGALGLIG